MAPYDARYKDLLDYCFHFTSAQEFNPQNPSAPTLVYSTGVALMNTQGDLVGVVTLPIHSPKTPWEIIGTVNHVVFNSGNQIVKGEDGKWYVDMYYGAADSHFAVARLSLDEIVELVMTTKPLGSFVAAHKLVPMYQFCTNKRVWCFRLIYVVISVWYRPCLQKPDDVTEEIMKRPKPPFTDQKIVPPGVEEEMNPRPQYKGKDYLSSRKLAGKVALITGGDSGIGRSVAYLYGREGAKVAITYLPEERRDVESLHEEMKAIDCELFSVAADVSSFETCENIVEQVVQHYGSLDILVNNAAFQKHVHGIDDLSLDQWDHTFKVNIYGYFYMVKSALPYLKKGSAIINTGSITGLEGSGGLLDYSATKGAIHAFTKSLARMLVEKNIRVNAVAPGPVWTPLNPAERPAEDVGTFGEGTPYGRPAQPDEIAPTYVFLASNGDSSYITGEVITLLGGQTSAG